MDTRVQEGGGEPAGNDAVNETGPLLPIRNVYYGLPFYFMRALGRETETCSSFLHRVKVRAAWYGHFLIVHYSELWKSLNSYTGSLLSRV